MEYKKISFILLLIFIVFFIPSCLKKKTPAAKLVSKSKDKSLIAFVSARDGSYKVYLKDLYNSKEEQPISPPFYFIENISFLHNSPRVVINGARNFGEKNSLYLFDVKSNTIENLIPDVEYGIMNFTVSPDDKLICYEVAFKNYSGWVSLYLLDLETKVTRAAVYLPGNKFHCRDFEAELLSAKQPHFSPDGRKICFAAVFNAFQSNQKRQYLSLGIVEVDSPSSVNFIHNITWWKRGFQQEYNNPIWSPDGQSIAFVYSSFTYDNKENEINKIYITAPDGSNLKEVLTCFDTKKVNFSALAWSSDGTRIFYPETAKTSSYEQKGRILDYRNYFHMVDINTNKDKFIILDGIEAYREVYGSRLPVCFNYYPFVIDEKNKKIIFCAHLYARQKKLVDSPRDHLMTNEYGPFIYEKNVYGEVLRIQLIYMVDFDGDNLQLVADSGKDYSPALYQEKK